MKQVHKQWKQETTSISEMHKTMHMIYVVTFCYLERENYNFENK